MQCRTRHLLRLRLGQLQHAVDAHFAESRRRGQRTADPNEIAEDIQPRLILERDCAAVRDTQHADVEHPCRREVHGAGRNVETVHGDRGAGRDAQRPARRHDEAVDARIHRRQHPAAIEQAGCAAVDLQQTARVERNVQRVDERRGLMHLAEQHNRVEVADFDVGGQRAAGAEEQRPIVDDRAVCRPVNPHVAASAKVQRHFIREGRAVGQRQHGAGLERRALHGLIAELHVVQRRRQAARLAERHHPQHHCSTAAQFACQRQRAERAGTSAAQQTTTVDERIVDVQLHKVGDAEYVQAVQRRVALGGKPRHGVDIQRIQVQIPGHRDARAEQDIEASGSQSRVEHNVGSGDNDAAGRNLDGLQRRRSVEGQATAEVDEAAAGVDVGCHHRAAARHHLDVERLSARHRIDDRRVETHLCRRVEHQRVGTDRVVDVQRRL